jgi:hypothetical protein
VGTPAREEEPLARLELRDVAVRRELQELAESVVAPGKVGA